MRSNSKIKEAIETVAGLLNGKIKWAVGGSGSLLVHGLDVHPNDLDIVVDTGDYQKSKTFLSEYIVSDASFGLRPQKSPILINEVEGDLLTFKIEENDLEYIQFGNTQIPVYKLSIEYKFYMKRIDKKESNLKKLKMIEQELKRRELDG